MSCAFHGFLDLSATQTPFDTRVAEQKVQINITKDFIVAINV